MSTVPVEEGMYERLRRLVANSGIYLTGDAVAQGLNLVLFPLYTRYLSPTDYGILALAQTVAIVLGIVFGLALSSALSRLHFEAESEEERSRLYGTVLAFLIVVPAIAAGLLHLAGKLDALDLFPSAPYTPYIQYAVGAAYLSVFLQVPVFIYQARQEARKVMALTILNATALTGATVLFVVVLDQGAVGALRGALIGAGITAVVSIAVTVRMSSRHLSRRWLTAALRFSLPLVPHLLGTWVLYLSDRFVLEGYVSTEELGLYSLGAAIGTAAHFLVTAAGRAFGPAITLALKSDRERDQVPVMGTFWVLGLTWACTAMALLLTDLIRLLAPTDFHSATQVVPWIVYGYLAFGVYIVVAQGTWFSMRTGRVAVLTLTAGAANVGLNFLLVPRYGIEGSAAATLIAFALLAVLQGALSQRLFHIAWEYERWARIAAAGAIAFGIGILGGGGTSVATVALKLAAIVIVLPATLTLLGFWRPHEWDSLRRRLLRGTPA